MLWLEGRDFYNNPQTITWKDKSIKGYNTSPYNFAYNTVSGSNLKSAVVFDGVDDYCIVNNLNNYQFSRLTLEMTYIPLVDMSSRFVAIKGNSNYAWGLYITTNSTGLGFYLRRTDGTVFIAGNTYGITTGKLIHQVGTFDGRYMKLYVNSVLKNTYDIGGPTDIISTTDDVQLGKWNANYANIAVYNFRVYNRALIQNEVIQNYNASRIGEM